MQVVTLLLLGLVFHATSAANQHAHGADLEDNDFAEFEEFDEDEGMEIVKDTETEEAAPAQKQPKVVMAPEAIIPDADSTEEEDATVEDDDDEFGHLQDEEEFEGFDKDRPSKGKGQEKPPDLKIAKVPILLRTNWDSFYLEMLMLAGLGVYFLNFLAGKTKNSKLAQAWLSSHRQLLEDNFAIVGDDGTSKEVQQGVLMKESENVYSLWCSGRVCCEGMLITLKLLKRQDLISAIAHMFKPASDQIIIKVTMDAADMDSFVFCLGNKKSVTKLHKEMVDLAWFCPDKRKADTFGLPASFQLLSEIADATTALLDQKVVAAISKFEDLVEYIHVSDQYCGLRSQDESQPSSMPETKKVLIFCFNVPGRGKAGVKDMEVMKPLLQMVFHCVDKVRRIRLSREAKQKAEKNRQKLEDSYSKAAHSQRAEAAQARREQKQRDARDKMMAEEDPDKQRRLEERNLKKEAKKKQPKVKMMKVKSV